ncbi:TPA: hypothetical protein ACJH2U_004667 [Salmonella enterica subsp. enterica serovar Saintpaul]
MTVKLTQTRLDNLIDTLNALICDDNLLNSEQKENMVRTVATLGGLEERIRQMTEAREAKKIAKAEKAEKKPREPDLVFPRTGKIWTSDDLALIHSIIVLKSIITYSGCLTGRGVPLMPLLSRLPRRAVLMKSGLKNGNPLLRNCVKNTVFSMQILKVKTVSCATYIN